MNPIFISVVKIRIDISVINRGKGITTLNNRINCPTRGPGTPAIGGRFVILDPGPVANPGSWYPDRGIGMNRMVAHEINREKPGDGTLGLLRQV